MRSSLIILVEFKNFSLFTFLYLVNPSLAQPNRGFTVSGIHSGIRWLALPLIRSICRETEEEEVEEEE